MKVTEIGWYALLLASAPLTASAKFTESSFVGVNLGPTYLTSVYATSDKDKALFPVPVAKIKASKAYRDYVVNSIDSIGKGTPGGHADASGEAILFEALSSIKKATEAELDGKPVTIGSISRPLYFNESSTTALAAAANRIHQGFVGKLSSATNAARIAYSLDSCEGFGMNKTNCDINEGEHTVVLLDYNMDYLELSLGHVSAERCEVRGYKLVRELGESHLAESTYNDQLHQVFKEFEGIHFGSFSFWDYSDHVRGVVLSGDASKNGMDTMRKSMSEAFPKLENRFKHSLSPEYVAASGAARLAQIEATIERLKNFVKETEQERKPAIEREADDDEFLYGGDQIRHVEL